MDPIILVYTPLLADLAVGLIIALMIAHARRRGPATAASPRTASPRTGPWSPHTRRLAPPHTPAREGTGGVYPSLAAAKPQRVDRPRHLQALRRRAGLSHDL
jgi:hypothetical protein